MAEDIGEIKIDIKELRDDIKGLAETMNKHYAVD